MLEKKEWTEFTEAGMLWFINRLLHLFGWAIVCEMEDGKIVNVYPTRCKFRGFQEHVETKGFIKVTKYLKTNIDRLLKESINA